MNTYYLAIFVSLFILSSTFIITSWGAIKLKVKMLFKKMGGKTKRPVFYDKQFDNKKPKLEVIDPEYIILKREKCL